MGVSPADKLLKMSLTGTAAIRQLAKEEVERPKPRQQKFHRQLNLAPSLVHSASQGRSHSADVPFHRIRRLPPLSNDSSGVQSLNSSLPRSVQSAPTTVKTAQLSPIRANSIYDQPRDKQRHGAPKCAVKPKYSASMDSSIAIHEADESDPD